MRTRDWKWIIGVLSGIIIFLFTYKFWGKPGNLTEVISIGSGLTSIALAIIAIIIAVSEGVRSSIKEQKANGALVSIIANIQVMKEVLSGVSKDNLKTHDQLSKIEDYIKFYGSNKEEIPVGAGVQYSRIDKGGLKEKANSEVDSNEEKNSEEKRVIGKSVKEIEESTDEITNSAEAPHIENINKSIVVKRGDMFWCDLGSTVGSEQGKSRPVIIVQNNVGNRFSPTVTIAPITAAIQKAKLPTHVEVTKGQFGMERDSVILLEQIRTIDKQRLVSKISSLDDNTMEKVDEALFVQLGLMDV